MDPDFQPGMNLLEKLQAAIDESRARVKQDLVLYRTQRPVKNWTGARWSSWTADRVSVEGARRRESGEGLGARQVVIATPVAANPRPIASGRVSISWSVPAS